MPAMSVTIRDVARAAGVSPGHRGPRAGRIRALEPGGAAAGLRERPRARIPAERGRACAGLAVDDDRRPRRRRYREPVLRRRRPWPERRDGRARLHRPVRPTPTRMPTASAGRSTCCARARWTEWWWCRLREPRPAIWPTSSPPACRSSCSTAWSPGVDADSVLVKNAAGAQAAVAHLIGLGHRRVGVVSDSPDITSSAERIDGYRKALRGAGIEVDPGLISIGGPTQADGEAAAMRLLDRADRPTAVFTANNFMTVGTLRAVRSARPAHPRRRRPGRVRRSRLDDARGAAGDRRQPAGGRARAHRRPAPAAEAERRGRPVAPDPAGGAPDRARLVRGAGMSATELLAELVAADSTNPDLEPGGAGRGGCGRDHGGADGRRRARGRPVGGGTRPPERGRPPARPGRRPLADAVRPHGRRGGGPRGVRAQRARRAHARPRHLRHEGRPRRSDAGRRAAGRRPARRRRARGRGDRRGVGQPGRRRAGRPAPRRRRRPARADRPRHRLRPRRVRLV